MRPSPEQFFNRVNLRHFRLLVAIATKGSILKAASSLNISQPTATKMLRDLEQDLGVELFTRGNRGVVPSLFGEAMLGHGRVLLAQAEHAAQEIADLASGTSGRVMVGTLLAASVRLLPAAVASLLRERPNVAVKVVEGANNLLMPQIQYGELDMIVGRLAEEHFLTEIDQIPLYDEVVHIVARCGHPLASSSGMVIADLAEAQWLLPPKETTLRGQVEIAFREVGLRAPHVAVESVSILHNLHLLRHTDLIAVMPDSVLRAIGRLHDIEPLPVVLEGFTRPIGIATRRGGRLPPAAMALVAHLQAAAQPAGNPASNSSSEFD